MNRVETLPFLGAGIGHRNEIHGDILEHEEEIGFIEIIPEKYLSATPKALDWVAKMSDQFTVIPHGVSLSIASAMPTSQSFLNKLKALQEIVKAPYYSEHVAVTRVPGVDIGHLSPIAYNDKMLDVVSDNVNRFHDVMGIPLVLENITETLKMPGTTMEAGEFFSKLCERTGCGMLLDLTNLYINSVNWQFDPYEKLAEFPLQSVTQVHLAGGKWYGDKLIDSHSESVPDPVWSLFEYAVRTGDIKGAVVERDGNFPEFSELLSELRQIKSIFAEASSASLPKTA